MEGKRGHRMHSPTFQTSIAWYWSMIQCIIGSLRRTLNDGITELEKKRVCRSVLVLYLIAPRLRTDLLSF